MNKVVLGLVLLTSLNAALSDVAFTTQSEMSKNTSHVLKNEMFKNESPTEETKDCIYFRDFEIVYKFENENKKHIYYFMFQCLDNAFNVLKSNVRFNYDGGDHRLELPDGCLPPEIPETPDNPCQHGYDLGTEVIKDISTIVTKKLINHPQPQIPEEIALSIDTSKLNTVNENLPGLQNMLSKLLENNHAANPENREPDDQIDNEDGTRTYIYHFDNGDVAEKTAKENGDIETILYKNDGTVEVQTIMPSGISDVTLYNAEGVAVYHKSFEPFEENPEYVKVTTFNYDDEVVGDVEIYPNFHRDDPVPLDVDFTTEVVQKLEEVNSDFADAIEKYVNEKLKCFSEHLINVKESYLTFVCSTTGHASIKDVIRKNFAETLVCGKHVNCEELEEELIDKMITDINMGGTGHGVSVQSDTIVQTVE